MPLPPPPQNVLSHERGQLTVDHLSLVIKAAALAGDYPAAKRAWEVVRANRFQPTLMTYTGLIAASVGAGEFADAYQYFNRCGPRCTRSRRRARA